MQEFRFRWTSTYRALALPFAVTPGLAVVQVHDDELTVRFGAWSLRTEIANVVSCEETSGYSLLRTAGPAHLSLADHGVTFATNGDRGMCMKFAEPVRAI